MRCTDRNGVELLADTSLAIRSTDREPSGLNSITINRARLPNITLSLVSLAHMKDEARRVEQGAPRVEVAAGVPVFASRDFEEAGASVGEGGRLRYNRNQLLASQAGVNAYQFEENLRGHEHCRWSGRTR